jgi:hypothetical protein
VGCFVLPGATSFTLLLAILIHGFFEMGEIQQGNAIHRNKPREIIIKGFIIKTKRRKINRI